jgi:uncharacterized protein
MAADPTSRPTPPMMKIVHCLFAVALLFSVSANAGAAPPTDAQVDKLMNTMDLRRTMDDMLVAMEQMSRNMGQQMLGDDATPEQREKLRALLDKQQASTRRILSWDSLAPIYRRVYSQLFSAEEVEAMIAFYGSEHGRSIMGKMPKAMELSMQEMQPLMQTMIADMQRELEAGMASDAKKAD